MEATQRVLLVEDERTIRDAVTAYLEREGTGSRLSATAPRRWSRRAARRSTWSCST